MNQKGDSEGNEMSLYQHTIGHNEIELEDKKNCEQDQHHLGDKCVPRGQTVLMKSFWH